MGHCSQQAKPLYEAFDSLETPCNLPLALALLLLSDCPLKSASELHTGLNALMLATGFKMKSYWYSVSSLSFRARSELLVVYLDLHKQRMITSSRRRMSPSFLYQRIHMTILSNQHFSFRSHHAKFSDLISVHYSHAYSSTPSVKLHNAVASTYLQ